MDKKQTAEWIAQQRAVCNVVEIPGAPLYYVERNGNVWSASVWRGTGVRKLVQYPNSYGYMRIRVSVNGQRSSKMVHSLVANAFLGQKPDGADQIRHLNGIKTDNRVENLAWGTAKENADDRERHGTTARGEANGEAKLKNGDIPHIRVLSSSGVSQHKIAKIYKVSQRTIWRIVHNEQWKQA